MPNRAAAGRFRAQYWPSFAAAGESCASHDCRTDGFRALGIPQTGSRAGRNLHPLFIGRDAAWQPHLPTPLALVHLQNQTGDSRGMVDRRFHQDKIRSHLRHRKGKSVHQETHVHLGGMPALSGQRNHGGCFHAKCPGLRFATSTPTRGAPGLRHTRYHLRGRKQVRRRQDSRRKLIASRNLTSANERCMSA